MINSFSSTSFSKSYKEFEEFCANEIDDATDVAYDVETNAEEVHNVNHRIVGFSIASNNALNTSKESIPSIAHAFSMEVVK